MLLPNSVIFATLLAMAFATAARAAEWQWSVPDGNARAYLWIPPDCQRVRAVVVANHNMIEQGILEHPTMRQTLGRLGIAEVWVVPAMDPMFEFKKGAGEHYQKVMDALAAVSGYDELSRVPAVPIGHSACASFPWNFAAWDKSRTLCALSVKGDAPHTRLTGNGRPNADWGDHDINGVPCLMIMGEWEWIEDRLMPLIAFKALHPATPVAFYFDAGRGHFDYSDELVAFLAAFIEKTAVARLPVHDGAPLRPVDPTAHWQVDRPNGERWPVAPAAPYAAFKGDPTGAFFCFDQEMAEKTEAHYAAERGKRPQLVGFVQDGQVVPQKNTHEQIDLNWQPEADGLTFKLQAAFLDAVPGGSTNPAAWARLPVGTPLGHAAAGGPIQIHRDVGPFVQLAPDIFRLQYGRAEYTDDRRNNDCWIWATHPGDVDYKSCVQQAMLRVPTNKAGTAQTIPFPQIGPQTTAAAEIALKATTDAGLPVQYYVREGPAEVDGDRLKLLPVPPRAKYPVAITVVAWQPGRTASPAVAAAKRVEQTFTLDNGPK
ncbi:MAG: hypothetical protein JWM57_3867 [Phycisphaerales bacterium]|nr:hypothetical protein [Phycisphaerales bacterium]